MAPKDLQVGQQAAIQYAYAKGKIVEPGLTKQAGRSVDR